LRALVLAIAISIFALVTPANAGGSCPQWEAVIRKAGLPVNEFSYIAYRESGCRIRAINARYDKNGKVIWTLNKNGSIDRGLFQINSVHKQTVRTICKSDLDELLTLPCNLKVAKYLYDRYGMTPWRGHSITPQSRTDAPAIRNVGPLDNLARNK
jgi:hypothetical protein